MADPGGAEGSGGDGESSGAQIRTFLIADVRGYTLFTQTRGDEAAAKLAARFAEIVRECVERRDGSVVELRGDEALCVFSSARQAIRAAVELQDRLYDETLSDPELPLPVGIGVDAGEAVAVEGGYRGGALNLAARLCGQAKAGEILASREVVHLARHVEGVRYQDQGSLRLKNLPEPVAVVRVISELGDPSEGLMAYAPPAPEPQAPKRGSRRKTLIAAGAAIALIAIGLPFVRSMTQEDAVSVQTNSLVSVNLDGTIHGSTPLDARPGAVAAGADAIWVASPDEGRVSRVDPGSGAVVDTIRVGADPSAIAVGEGSVWVANAGGPSVSRINPDTNEVVDTIETCSGPNAIAAGLGAVWVTCAFDNLALRIDATSGETQQIRLPGAPAGVAVGSGALWISITTTASVVRIDPATLQILSEIEVGNGPESLVAASGSIWVANRLDGTVDRLDPETGTRRATIDVGRDPSALQATSDAVWVTASFDGAVLGVDPQTNLVASRTDLGKATGSLAQGEGLIWTTAGAAVGDHRGGTLRITTSPLDTIDPGFAYDTVSYQILSLTNDGLVGYRRVGGIGGATLVPDLAVSLPAPTDGGKTYRFQLRPGIRYSTGDVIQPTDVRFAIERVVGSRSDGRQYFTGLVGADRCVPGVACDLSEAIEVGATTGTITFHLDEPDPDFLHKLAMAFAFPVPASTPARNRKLVPVPATGPYVITTITEDGIELARNPEFRAWGSPARPEGFPDRIVVTISTDDAGSVDQVLDGSIDWTSLDPPLGRIEELMTDQAGQIHPTPNAAQFFMVLNTSAPPFDDVRVRRAVNLGVDRDRIVAIYRGTARSTCQLLPPNFPAYQPYCPFTIHPGPTWDGPDLKAARELIADADAEGTRVEVSTFTGLPGARALAAYFVELLQALGMDGIARNSSDANDHFTRIYSGRTQMALSVWFPDYPAPGGVIPPQFRCGTLGNAAHFCDPSLDERMDQAGELQVTDPAGGTELWAEIDRRIVDLAPHVPLVVRTDLGLVSTRVGNYQIHINWGVLLDQLWVV